MIRHGDTKVAEIMTKQLICIDYRDTIGQVVDLIKKHGVRHLPVMDGEQLVGILSKSDIDKVFFQRSEVIHNIDVNDWSIEQFMTKNVNTIQHDDTIKEAGEVLSLMAYHALPVMDGERLVGIITSTDLILYFLKICDQVELSAAV